MPATQTFKIAGHEWTVVPLETDEQIEVECILARLIAPVAGAAVAAVVQGLAPALVAVLRDTVLDTNKTERALAEVEVRMAVVVAATVERDGLALVLTFASESDATAAHAIVAGEIVDRMEFADPDIPTQIRIEVLDAIIEADDQPFELARLMDLDTADPRLRVAFDHLLDALSATVGELVRDAAGSLAGRLDHRSILRLFELVILGPGKTRIKVKGGPAYVTSAKLLSKSLAHNPRAKWDLLGRALLVTYGPDPETEDEPEDAGDA